MSPGEPASDQRQGSAHMREFSGAIRPLFWDHDLDALSWERDRDLVIGRVLAEGGWDAISWLRSRIGDRGLRDWIRRRQGRGLSPQQLRFWELILDLPNQEVSDWLAQSDRQSWDSRLHQRP